MSEPFDILKEVLDELYRKNDGEAPTAKQMAAACRIPVKEAKQILDDLLAEPIRLEPKPKRCKKEKSAETTASTASSAKDPRPSQPADEEARLSAVPPGAFEEADSDEEHANEKEEEDETQLDESAGPPLLCCVDKRCFEEALLDASVPVTRRR
eukprot:s2440_g15.t1